MSLSDLSKRAPDQQRKINKLCEFPETFSTSGLTVAAWGRFRDSLWGKDLDSLEKQTEAPRATDHHPQQIPDSYLALNIPETMPDAMNLDGSRFFVRSEYEEAERAILSANASGVEAFLVTGQPGIGKSVFLVRVLMRRLVRKIPTALQVSSDYAILFHEGGTLKFGNLTDVIPYLELSSPLESRDRIWALVDLNKPGFFQPATIFVKSRPFFTVAAVSPHQKRHDWTSEVDTQVFCMKSWSFSEVLQARDLIGRPPRGPYEEEELRHFYDKYGASPRALAKYTRAEKEYQNQVIYQVGRVQPGSLRHALLSPDLDEISHLIAIIEPSPESRSGCQKRIASRWIFEQLFDRYMKTVVPEMKYFHDVFRQNSTTAPAAGWLFELRMHQVLRRPGYPLKLFPVRGHTGEANYIYDDYSASSAGHNPMTFQLTGSEEYFLRNDTDLEVGRYYRPEPLNFPSFDSLLVVKPQNESFHILLLIQMTENKTKHDVKERGFQVLEDLRLRVPTDTRSCYVVVTPRGTEPRITAPRSQFLNQRQEAGNGQGEGRMAETVSAVYHHPVDLEELFRPPQ